MKITLTALTTPELESVITAFDGMHAAYDLLVASGALEKGDEYDIDVSDIIHAICEEIEERDVQDAAYKVNQMVGRGEVDRYMRPDGEVGYAPPGVWDELA